MGRPTKLTPKLTREVADLVRAGNYLETAAAAVGVSRSTLNKWIRDGRRIRDDLDRGPRDPKGLTAAEGRVAQFSAAIGKARALSEAEALDRIAEAGRAGSWQADAWRLERKYPDRYGRRVQVAGDPEAPLVTAHLGASLEVRGQLGQEAVLALAAKLTQAVGGPLDWRALEGPEEAPDGDPSV